MCLFIPPSIFKGFSSFSLSSCPSAFHPAFHQSVHLLASELHCSSLCCICSFNFTVSTSHSFHHSLPTVFSLPSFYPSFCPFTMSFGHCPFIFHSHPPVSSSNPSLLFSINQPCFCLHSLDLFVFQLFALPTVPPSIELFIILPSPFPPAFLLFHPSLLCFFLLLLFYTYYSMF